MHPRTVIRFVRADCNLQPFFRAGSLNSFQLRNRSCYNVVVVIRNAILLHSVRVCVCTCNSGGRF